MENKIAITWFAFILAFMWSVWVFANFPTRQRPLIQLEQGKIGYIDVMNSDGTGPIDDSSINIRCFTDRDGIQIDCPVFKNWVKKFNK